MNKNYILHPSHLILFYNELSSYYFANSLYTFKVKLYDDTIIRYMDNMLFLQNKILENKKTLNRSYMINLLFFYFKMNFFGKSIRFRISGRGYRLFSELNHILFKLGYSHVINFTLPIQYEMSKKEKHQSFFKITGLGVNNINNMLFNIKVLRQPNIYSKKGIFIKDKFVQFKEGKKNFTL